MFVDDDLAQFVGAQHAGQRGVARHARLDHLRVRAAGRCRRRVAPAAPASRGRRSRAQEHELSPTTAELRTNIGPPFYFAVRRCRLSAATADGGARRHRGADRRQRILECSYTVRSSITRGPSLTAPGPVAWRNPCFEVSARRRTPAARWLPRARARRSRLPARRAGEGEGRLRRDRCSIKDEGFGRSSRVMEFASWLTDVYGPRLTNSPQYKAAGEYVKKQMTELGFANVKLEPWGPFGRGWSNEYTHVRVVAPYTTTLMAYLEGLGARHQRSGEGRRRARHAREGRGPREGEGHAEGQVRAAAAGARGEAAVRGAWPPLQRRRPREADARERDARRHARRPPATAGPAEPVRQHGRPGRVPQEAHGVPRRRGHRRHRLAEHLRARRQRLGLRRRRSRRARARATRRTRRRSRRSCSRRSTTAASCARSRRSCRSRSRPTSRTPSSTTTR